MKATGRAARKGLKKDSDSDSYPQGPYLDGGGESDGPEHCDANEGCINAMEFAGTKVGVWLGNPLTNEGVRELKEMLSNPRPTTYQLALHEFWSSVYADYLAEVPSPQLPLLGAPGAVVRSMPPARGPRLMEASEIHSANGTLPGLNQARRYPVAITFTGHFPKSSA